MYFYPVKSLHVLHYNYFLSFVFPTDGCEIGTIRPNTRLIHRKDNYQDDDISTNLNEINKRLEQCLKYLSNQAGTPCCGQFDFVNNNCEHTVTYIRYGMEGRVSCLVCLNCEILLNSFKG